jgi:phasin family protein
MQPSSDHLEHIEKATQGVMKACEDASCMAKDHVDATMKAAAVVGKGMEEIMRNTSSLVQESMARGMEVSKTIMNAKSVPEAMNTHSEFMKDCFDTWVAATGKISEISARMAQEAMSPIAENTNNAINKISQKVKQAA